jgi:hypothetical protein
MRELRARPWGHAGPRVCSVEAVLDPGGRYELTVDVVDYDLAKCAISPAS